MAALLEKEVGSLLEEKEKMKKIINNYDWKLFCLETELDLSNKEKKQYKFVNDKHENRMAEFEATVKQMTIKIYSLEEEVKAIEEENRFLEAETDHKQRKINDLTAQLEEAQNGETVKEFEYRLREKDEELTEITSYLKEKMKEHHEIKLRSGQLEKSLQEAHKKVEKAEFEAYEMEQCLIEH
jgi:chromosome segregation ATPase